MKKAGAPRHKGNTREKGMPMILSDDHRDALVELINIGFGKAADSLSRLVRHRVLLRVPEVYVEPVTRLTDILGERLDGDVATVHQIFSGMISGNAMLLLDYSGAVVLSELLAEDRVPLPRLDESDREVLTEVGNIVLNACLGTFSNILKVHVSFSVPRLALHSLDDMLRSLVVNASAIQHALVVVTTFRIKDKDVEGYLMLIMGVTSMERLLDVLDRWMLIR